MSEGPSAGQILLGIFLILCGLCLALVGGGCAVLWIATMFSGAEGAGYAGGILLVLVSLATLAGGAVTFWAGGKLVLGK